MDDRWNGPLASSVNRVIILVINIFPAISLYKSCTYVCTSTAIRVLLEYVHVRVLPWYYYSSTYVRTCTCMCIDIHTCTHVYTYKYHGTRVPWYWQYCNTRVHVRLPSQVHVYVHVYSSSPHPAPPPPCARQDATVLLIRQRDCCQRCGGETG